MNINLLAVFQQLQSLIEYKIESLPSFLLDIIALIIVIVFFYCFQSWYGKLPFGIETIAI